uniref:GulC n=1 Tax=Pyxidicoccus fallax TaxID=394095 RepID=A0A097I350_9BACT|nr:GulC [Pyxidicoccus fallax]
MTSVDERIKNLSPQKRALLEQRMNAAAASATRDAEPIAIIGIGCRYPGGVKDLKSFAQLLRDGADATGDIPADRWDVEAHYSPDPGTPGKMRTRRGGFLPDVKTFDADFFGISPREAQSMDPQQRLLLEVSYEALEDAGIPTASLSGSTTGVYIGITLAEYADRLPDDPRLIDVYSGTGTYLNVAAGRLSYVYGLQGPCMAVDAACASSLVTVHLAAQALRHRECGLALAGGVSLMLSPETTIYLSQTGALAPDGRCKTFDARANGYGRAEGCGILVLKRLSDALRDKDRIHALIRGTAVSQDGASSGLTVPNGRAQQKVIQSALKDAAVRSEDVSYVEAHGTGTPLGDPIELNALQAVYGQREADWPLHVGSLKTNFGHAEAAAGVGGIIKTVVALQERQIPAHLHFEKLNPLITIDPTRVVIPTRPTPWQTRGERKRLAGVSSFGFSGVIAHAVLEEAPAPEAAVEQPAMPAGERPLHVLPLTAKHPRALSELISAYRHTVGALDAGRLADLGYTASRKRGHHAHRAWFAFRDKEELLQQLEAATRGHELPGAVLQRQARDDVKVVMVFPGQGSQWVGMGQQLMRTSPVFREAIHELDRAMRPWADFSLLEVLGARGGEDPFTRVSIVQPTLFAVQVALARQWEAWGVRPHAVIGHSMGEVAAACVAGALSMEDAAAVICRRSQLVQATSGQGAMALVELSPAEVEAAIAPHGDRVSIAAYNGPSTVLLSGEPAAVDEVLTALQERGAFCRRVKVDYASHCAQMDPLLGRIRSELAHVKPRKGGVPIYSTARGEVIDGSRMDAGYWADNLRRPVLFHAQVKALLADGMSALLEISPHPVLLPSMQKTLDEAGGQQLVLPSLRRDEDEPRSLATSLGALFGLGHPVDFSAFTPRSGRLVETPRYPWQRREFWLTRKASKRRHALGGAEGHPLIGGAFRPAVGPESYYWEFDVDEERLAFIADHRVRGMTVLPGTAYLDLALSAARAAFGDKGFPLSQVSFREALTLLPEQPRRVQLSLVREAEGAFSVCVSSRDAASPATGEWTLHATMRLDVEAPATGGARAEGQVTPPAGAELRDARTHYRLMKEGGLAYGPRFQGLAEVHCGQHEALGRLRALPELGLDGADHVFHPALWDAAHQALAALLGRQDGHASGPSTWIPRGIERVSVSGTVPAREALWVRASARVDADGATARGDLQVLDDAGRVLVETRGLTLLRRDADNLDDVRQWFFRPVLREAPLREEAPADGTWLVLGAPGPLHDRVVAELRGRGLDTVQAFPANSWEEQDAARFHLSPADPEHLRRLMERVSADRPLRGLINLQPYQVARGDAASSAPEGVLSALYMEVLDQARALQGVSRRERPKLVLVSGVSQGAEAEPDLVAAPLQGLGRVIAAELPRLHCVQVQLGGQEPEVEARDLVRELYANDGEDEVVLRGGARHVRRLERLVPGAAPAAPIHADGTYLLTGGLGGLGLAFASWLADRGARHLALVSRRPPSEEARARLDALRARGVEVLVREVDLSREDSVAALFRELDERMPPLRGVLHLAGVLDDATLFQQNEQRLAAVRGPKVTGTRLLHAHTQHRKLDFFVLFSAGATLLGSPGQANYAAVNAFMDAFAPHRQRLGLPALSINWGVWDEVGLAAASAQRGQRLREQGLFPIPPAQGLQAFELALSLAGANVAILPIRLARWLREHPDLAGASLFKELVRGLDDSEAEAEAPILEQLRATVDPHEQRECLRRWVGRQLAAVLRRDPASMQREQNFSAMGVDSLMALEFRNRLERSLHVRLPPTMVFNHPSIEALCGFLEPKLGMGAPSAPAQPEPVPAPAAPVRVDEKDGAALLGALARLKKLTQQQA